MIAFTCPSCRQPLRVPEGMLGKRVSCPHCRQAMALPGPPPAVSQPPEQETKGFTFDPRTAPTAGGEDLPPFSILLSPPQRPDELGRLGPFRVLRVLGKGGMGIVFEAEDSQLRRPVALKTMLPAVASPAARERFLREARAIAALQHDHVVTVYQVGEERGVPYFAMPLLEGETLEDRLKRLRCLQAAETMRIAREIAEGLAAAHQRGLIHRDVKPANVWLESKRDRAGPRGGDRVKILDFGLARGADDDQLTGPGAFLGTPAYVAPEQAGGETVDCRCDLFSLGCVIYRMGTGRLPFHGPTPMVTLKAVMLDEPEPPHEVAAGFPEPLSDLVMRLLSKSPAGRPSARAVVEELAALAEDETLQNRPAPRRPEPPPRREMPRDEPAAPSRRLVLLIAGVVVALLGVGLMAALAVVVLNRPSPPEKGTVVIEGGEPAAEVIITQRGGTIHRGQAREVELAPGAYEIALAEPMEGQRFDPPAFTVSAGGRTVVRSIQDPIRPAQNPPPTRGVIGRHGDYVSIYGADGAAFEAWVAGLKKTGHRPTFLNGYALTLGQAGATLYAGIAVKDGKGQRWEVRHRLTSVQYQDTFEELKPKGHVPVSVTGYREGEHLWFGGIWAQVQDHHGWYARHNLVGPRHQAAIKDHTGEGLGLAYVTGYWDGEEPRFSSLFLGDVVGSTAVHDLTSDDYQRAFADLERRGYRPLSVSGYHGGGTTRYAAVFVKDGHKRWESRHGMTPAAYKALAERLTSQGYHPTVICGHLHEGELCYSTVWVKD